MGKMRLSTAMRRGDAIVPETAKAHLFERAGKIVAACAMGKAYIGIHGLEAANKVRNVELAYQDLYKRYNIRDARAVDPQKQVERTIETIIWGLNDGPEPWTTEQIADWLKSIGR